MPVRDVNGLTILDHDEHRRPTTDMQSLAALKPAFATMGDQGGFDAVAIQAHPEVEAWTTCITRETPPASWMARPRCWSASEAAGRAHGLKPRARVRAFANIGSDPALMLTGPVDVTRKLLARVRSCRIDDIDLFEVNEAFAAVVLRYLQAFDIAPEIVNVNGGAIAMGHPLGATGAMLLGTAVDELERTGKRLALVTLCIGAGMGTATIIERV